MPLLLRTAQQNRELQQQMQWCAALAQRARARGRRDIVARLIRFMAFGMMTLQLPMRRYGKRGKPA